MSNDSRGLSLWMGLAIIVLLLICIFFLSNIKAESEGGNLNSDQVETSEEVKKIITRESMDFALVVDKDGAVVPVTSDRLDAPRCGELGDDQLRTCTFFRENGIQAKKIEHVSVSIYTYKFNPECRMYEVIINGVKHYFTHPGDSNC